MSLPAFPLPPGYGDWATMPADLLADVVSVVLWDMGGEKDAPGMLVALQGRPDVATTEVQAAIAVIEDYLAPDQPGDIGPCP